MLFERPESPRLLDNDYLDFFTRAHWVSVPLLFVPIGAAFVLTSLQRGVGPVATAGLFALGFVLWTLAEYWLHRTVFHWAPEEGWGAKLHYWIHGVHHQLPHDPYRLVMPPWVNLGLLAFVAAPLFLGIAGAHGWAPLAGFVVGYMNYDVTHWYLHHCKPRTRFGKRLRAHHMSHHFAKHRAGTRFGVSFDIWDRVFGTM